jgi:hypothetical protein
MLRGRDEEIRRVVPLEAAAEDVRSKRNEIAKHVA